MSAAWYVYRPQRDRPDRSEADGPLPSDKARTTSTEAAEGGMQQEDDQTEGAANHAVPAPGVPVHHALQGDHQAQGAGRWTRELRFTEEITGGETNLAR